MHRQEYTTQAGEIDSLTREFMQPSSSPISLRRQEPRMPCHFGPREHRLASAVAVYGRGRKLSLEHGEGA